MNNKSPTNKSNRDVMRYASMGTQLLVAIGFAVFLGIKADAWLHVSPLLACLLPLLVLTLIFYKLIRETKPPKNEK